LINDTFVRQQAAVGARRSVVDVDKDLELQEARRAAAQTARDQLIARVGRARCAENEKEAHPGPASPHASPSQPPAYMAAFEGLLCMTCWLSSRWLPSVSMSAVIFHAGACCVVTGRDAVTEATKLWHNLREELGTLQKLAERKTSLNAQIEEVQPPAGLLQGLMGRCTYLLSAQSLQRDRAVCLQ